MLPKHLVPEEVLDGGGLPLGGLGLLQQLPEVRRGPSAVGGGHLGHDGLTLLHAVHGQQPPRRLRQEPDERNSFAHRG